MPDVYPELPSLPGEWLVPADAQPQYTDLPGVVLRTDLGSALSDAHVARGAGADPAIVDHDTGRTISYAELAESSGRAATVLRDLGVQPGDRVALKGPNCPDLLIAAIGAWKLGAVVVPVPVLARAGELRFLLEDTAPAVLVIQAGCEDQPTVVEVADEVGVRRIAGFGNGHRQTGVIGWDEALHTATVTTAASVPLDSVAIVWHTGGTTGVPKGCYHTQRRFLLAGHALGTAAGVAPGQRWMAAAPIGHALGMIHHTIFTLLHGATIVTVARFTDPRCLLEAIDAHGVTTFTAITASWAGMLDALRDGTAPEPRTLRTGYAMWQSSSSSEVTDGWRERGIALLNNFGSTAFATWVLLPWQGDVVPQGSLGRPAPGYEVRVLQPATQVLRDAEPGAIGQLAVRGPTGLTYWRLPDKQATDVRDGWTVVDDLVQQEDEFYSYLGRTDFLISSAGNKISPGEVERVLAGHPAVQELVVMGLPDPIRQEAVSAFVVVADGYEASDDLRLELQNLVKRTLAPYKFPRNLEFVAALPRDHVGKVLPKVLRDRALARMEGASS